MCCTRLDENTWHKKDAKLGHLRTIVQICRAISSHLRHVSTFEKPVISNISTTCPHNMMNFGPLTVEAGWRVSCTPANFNGVRVLASLLHRRCSTEVNQNLHDVWPSPGLVYYIHFRWLMPPNGILPFAKFTLRPSPAFSYYGSFIARHWSSGRQPSFAA